MRIDGVRNLVVAVIGASALVTGACAPAAPSGTGSTTTSTPNTPLTRIYMSAGVDYGATPAGTVEASVDMKVSIRGCTDPDTCPGGVRTSDNSIWYSALSLQIGSGAGSGSAYGMHGGLMFGRGVTPSMYVDWSGYCPPNLGGGVLRDGGGRCLSTTGGPDAKPHVFTGLDTSRTYRVAVVRRACSVPDVTDVTGPLTGWELLVTDLSTGAVRPGGTWCLPNADRIEYSSAFSEVVEGYARPQTSNGPCTTDFGSLELSNARYRVGSTWTATPQAFGHYDGNQTALDADCGNVNLRSPSPGVVIVERMTPKGAGGGLIGPGWL